MKSSLFGIAMQIFAMAIIISAILLFLGIGMMVLIQICILGRAYQQNLSEERESSNNGKGKGLSIDELEKLPQYDYVTKDTKDRSNESAECAVCLEKFRGGDKCRLLPDCKHSFHAICVDSWLMKTAVCPICRACTQTCVGRDGIEMTEREAETEYASPS